MASSPATRRRLRPLLIAATACAVALLGACSSPPALSDLDLDAYDAVVGDAADALEDQGIIAPGTIERHERGAGTDSGTCKVHIGSADAETIETQPGLDEVLTAVEPTLDGSGFESLEEEEAYGGHLKLVATDEQGARLQILWKASRISISLSADVDLDDAECTDDAVA